MNNGRPRCPEHASLMSAKRLIEIPKPEVRLSHPFLAAGKFSSSKLQQGIYGPIKNRRPSSMASLASGLPIYCEKTHDRLELLDRMQQSKPQRLSVAAGGAQGLPDMGGDRRDSRITAHKTRPSFLADSFQFSSFAGQFGDNLSVMMESIVLRTLKETVVLTHVRRISSPRRTIQSTRSTSGKAFFRELSRTIFSERSLDITSAGCRAPLP